MIKVKPERSLYDDIELTEDEIHAALLEAKKKKYFHEKHKEYWEAQENGKTRKQLHESIRV